MCIKKRTNIQWNRTNALSRYGRLWYRSLQETKNKMKKMEKLFYNHLLSCHVVNVVSFYKGINKSLHFSMISKRGTKETKDPVCIKCLSSKTHKQAKWNACCFFVTTVVLSWLKTNFNACKIYRFSWLYYCTPRRLTLKIGLSQLDWLMSGQSLNRTAKVQNFAIFTQTQSFDRRIDSYQAHIYNKRSST